MRKDKTCAGGGRWRPAAVLLTVTVMAFVLAACACSSEENSGDTATETSAEEETVTTAEEGTLQDSEDPADDETAEEAEGETNGDAESADSAEQEETDAETTAEPETTTRSEAEVGVKTLTDGTAAIAGYEVSLYLPLPEAWEEYDLDGETIYVSEDYPLSVPNISVYAAENDGSLAYTTEEIIEAVCEETFADMSFTMGEFENTTISGYDAVIYSYSIVTGETEITQYYVLVETELTLFRITFTDTGDAYAEVFEECIDGITIS